MKIANRRIVSAVAVGAFIVAVAAGLISRAPAESVLLKALAAGAVAGGGTAFVAFIFERVWTR